MVMWIMSDRTIPRSFRFMEGFGVHTFRLIDGAGKTTFVKFHWKPKLGLQSVAWNEAVKLNGADPNYHRRDLWDAITAGTFPEWEFGVQLFDEEFADSFEFDVLDATKMIPEELVPVKIVDRLVLDRVVDNFFAETEQVAFSTGKGRSNYEPNSWGPEIGGPRESSVMGYKSAIEQISGDKLQAKGELFADHYSQARQFYTSQMLVEQNHIKEALAFELSKVELLAIRVRMVSHLLNIDGNLAKTVADGLGLSEIPQPHSHEKVVPLK
jgi:catalase